MRNEQDERRFVEEEMRDLKKRAAKKPNLAVSAPWVLAGMLVLFLILILITI